MNYSEWVRMTADGIAVDRPCVLHVITGDASAAGDIATVYDGLDAVSGRQLLKLEAPANQHRQVDFGPRGILMSTGVYVDMATNGLEVIVVFNEVE